MIYVCDSDDESVIRGRTQVNFWLQLQDLLSQEIIDWIDFPPFKYVDYGVLRDYIMSY